MIMSFEIAKLKNYFTEFPLNIQASFTRTSPYTHVRTFTPTGMHWHSAMQAVPLMSIGVQWLHRHNRCAHFDIHVGVGVGVGAWPKKAEPQALSELQGVFIYLPKKSNKKRQLFLLSVTLIFIILCITPYCFDHLLNRRHTFG